MHTRCPCIGSWIFRIIFICVYEDWMHCTNFVNQIFQRNAIACLSPICCYLSVFSYGIFCVVFMCTPMNFSHRSASTGSDGFIIIVYANGILFVCCLFFFTAWSISNTYYSEFRIWTWIHKSNENKIENLKRWRNERHHTHQQPTAHKVFSAQLNAAVCARVIFHSFIFIK